MNILVTSGATREPIDGIRFITNWSGGSTGAMIADVLIESGHCVTYLHGQAAKHPKRKGSRRLKLEPFTSFQSLDGAIQRLLQDPYHVVINVAAVSDFSVASIQSGDKRLNPMTVGKINSSEIQNGMVIHLKKNHKIVNRIKTYAVSTSPVVVAFKLTNTDEIDLRESAILRLTMNPNIDYVVHNDFGEIVPHRHHSFSIYRRDQKILVCPTKRALAEGLISIIQSSRDQN